MIQRFHAPDMSCNHCVARIRSALEATGKTREIQIDLNTKTVQVDTDLAVEEVRAILDEAGYPATQIPD